MIDKRVSCLVPDCHRWSARSTLDRKGWHGFCCGSHWRRITRREKAALNRVRRLIRRLEAVTGEPAPILREREARIWWGLMRRAGSRPPVEPR